MRSGRHIGENLIPSGTLGEALHYMSCRRSLSVASLVSTVPPHPPRYPALLTVVPKSHNLCKIKGSCITISDWVILF